jgi:signal transduction histidine kinase
MHNLIVFYEEIESLKNAFEVALEFLQVEYTKQMEFEKKSALLDLSAQVAHDLKTPLAVIEMMFELTKKYMPEDEVSIQKAAVEKVKQIINKLLEKYR